MVSKFLSFTSSNNIAIKKAKTLVTVSGGIDSVTLAYLFSAAKLNFGIAHCNFNLRGKESDEDEMFVDKLAKTLNVKTHIVSFDTTEIARIKGVSIQMAARDLRYEWFEKIRGEFSYDFIATAHHKGDAVETVLFNLSKTCGLEGLHGIKVKLGDIIRPLLFAERRDIELFANENKITWREDSSNSSIKYSRNKIRHKVVPLLEDINPKAQEAIFNTSARIAEAEKFLNFAIKNVSDDLLNRDGDSIFIDKQLLQQTPGFTYVLFELLKPFNFNYNQAKSITKVLNNNSGKLIYSKSHVVNIDRSHLIVSPTPIDNGSVYLKKQEGVFIIDELKVTTVIHDAHNYSIKNNKLVLGLDLNRLVFPLEVRKWQQGDIFYPLGMKGKKKLSNFMIDAKIPVNLKEQIRVVVSENNIAGILNHRLDRRFKIDENTKEVFEITCH